MYHKLINDIFNQIEYVYNTFNIHIYTPKS